MSDTKKILVSGVKPTGRPHIGNYFGAMKQFVDLQDEYRSFIFLADLHALTSVQNKEQMQQNTIDVALDYLAIGLDPQKVTLYKQSDIGTHTELTWIFNCLTTMPYLMRAHAFKDAEAKNKDINVGTFDYPLLMASDILLYDADVVPVGKDQKQHVEITRDLAEKFNSIFGQTFKLPQEMILENVETVIGTDGQKMSKSYGNTIPLFAEREDIQKAIMSIPTDSTPKGDPLNTETDITFKLHTLFASEMEIADLKEKYQTGAVGYKETKELLIEKIDAFTVPLREKRKEWEEKTDEIKSILEDGAQVARKISDKKLQEVKEKAGFTL